MTAKSTRILKEVRPLAWPWCAVALAGALPLFPSLRSAEWITAAGFYLGIPILATLAFGNEFRDRTFALVLSQPIERGEIWREKLIVTVFAVVTAALVFSLTLGVQINHQYPHFFIFIAAWTLATIASAAFWTLWTRSTMGGVALNLAALGLILTWVDVATHLIDSPYSVEENSAAISRIALLLVTYAALMLWLGWRRLERFQVTGTMAGDDLVTAGPDFMPSAVAEWFRSRSSGAVLNLVRKEFRLLRPVWLLTILIAVGWSSVTVYQVLHQREHVKFMPFTAGVVGVAGAVLLAVLAGCMSLGEERASGRHAWHLTLPVAARTQWLVKFLMALFAGTICAGVLPLFLLAAGQNLLGMSVLPDLPDYPTVWFWSVLTITATAFWCSCAADGTLTAALWVVPVLAAIGFAPEVGNLFGRELIHLLDSKFNLFGDFRWDVAIFHFHPPWPVDVAAPPRTLYQAVHRWVLNFIDYYGFNFGDARLVVYIPAAVLGVVQSYRMFKKQAIAGARAVVRRLLPLVAVTIACAIALSTSWEFINNARGHAFNPIWETEIAIDFVLDDSGGANLGKPMNLTAADLDNAYPLPKVTLAWLHNARIKVTPYGPIGGIGKLNGRPLRMWFYDATIHLEDGTYLTMSFERQKGTIVRIRWPGSAEYEPLWGR